jgi:hypothetical protein
MANSHHRGQAVDRKEAGYISNDAANFLFCLTVDKSGQRHFSQMAWIKKKPTTSITAQVTP